MMYDAYQALADVGDRVRLLAANAETILSCWSSRPWASPLARMAAYYEVVALAGFTHNRPDYGVDSVEVRGETRAVTQNGAMRTPFCQLLHFSKEGGADDPKVLLVAPMSGHFATLLRGTLRTVLRDHQVYLTDWINPRNVKLDAGRFGLEDYTRHLIDFVGHIGEDCHIVAVCQPTVSALAAVAVMAMDGANVQPASLTLMAGPIDVRIAPNKVNQLASEKPYAWFRDNLIGTVPWKFEGRGRRVYPGFLQLSAFMSMNADRHSKAFVDLFKQQNRRRFRKGGRDQGILPGIFRDHGHDRGFLSRDDRSGVPALPAAAGADAVRGPRDSAPRDSQDLPLDRGGREGRHLLGRPDPRRARPLFRPAPLHEIPPPASRRRPLRRLQRPPLGCPGLPRGAQPHPGEPVRLSRAANGGPDFARRPPKLFAKPFQI